MGVDWFLFVYYQMMVDGVNGVPTNPYGPLRRRINAIN